MRKIGRLLAFVVLSAVLAGCASGVVYTLDLGYGKASPARIALLPVIIEGPVDAGDKDIGELFRTMSYERLRQMNYSPVPLDEIDRRLGGEGDGKAPQDIARLLGADAVLYIRVAGWNKGRLPAYASLKVEGSYELYSSDGRRLWSASHSTKESDLGLDGKAMEVGVLKAYEPRIQRFVDDVFSTLPHREARQREKETFYQWLP
ncbi:MAG: hypothetical protein HZB22_00945 [Deltaproteobacteria bacterium]|nr:hypothetical protein [Deltaproteobacteria bacterium]